MPWFEVDTPDGMLVAAANGGDREAFAQVVARYQPALLRAAVSRLGQRHLAEEAVQEALLCAHRWLASYDSRHSFRTWLWTILLNQCSRQGKREARQAPVPGKPPGGFAAIEPVCPGRGPLEQLLAREDAERLNQLLARLPEVQADALRLRFFGSLTFPEIAAAMRSSEPGAKLRVKNGLLTLAKWLNEAAETNPGQPAAGSKAALHHRAEPL
jgi:RNA polymerase sigma-70 factor (ECF subfamily)